ncbi:phosphatidylethanolamine-binding protein [Polychytrium aggregatum]|uniref:phosphatidylethanolamine-binding protein n=1 Tax=Polychytrium aggregatum TaxID=110093 RepID=UPI0022FE85CE|nr:phosphatidylethanolamine-binding protein [Polychytrium aggregatum]KAI9203384.1 phosphatidylethanolamine-binding protein [Polychytrium aggregatum]
MLTQEQKMQAALLKASKALIDSSILGEVVPAEFRPSVELNVKYLSKKVTYGKELNIDVSWIPEEGAYYTLILTDPDVPSRKNPEDGEYRHWVVSNILNSDYANGEDLTEYEPPCPPVGTGLHRYIFLLYKQPGFLDLSVISKRRERWEADSWAKSFGMELVGCNFFKGQQKQ